MLAHGFRGLDLKLLDSINPGPGMWHNIMPLNSFVAVTRSNIKKMDAWDALNHEGKAIAAGT